MALVAAFWIANIMRRQGAEFVVPKFALLSSLAWVYSLEFL